MSGPDRELDRLIDRLVDDELDSERRRQLLAQLDAESDGWRRCALAFIEAAEWRKSLRSLPGRSSRADAPSTSSRYRPGPRPSRIWLVAAGLLLAFASGWTARERLPHQAGQGPSPLAEAHPTVKPGLVATNAAPSGRSAHDERSSDVAPLAAQPLPVAAYDGETLVDRLREDGFRVENHRQLLATQYVDGQPVAVPVEEIRVRYVGGRIY